MEDTMAVTQQSFYDSLKEYLESYPGSYNHIIDYSPDLFKLLTDILNEKVLSADNRLKISAALGYFVVPIDVVPESIYGPEGYIDDLYLCCHVLNDIVKELGYSFIEDLWEGSESLDLVLDKCLKESEAILADEKIFVLKYVGFQ